MSKPTITQHAALSACKPADVEAVGKLFDGHILKALLALIAQFGPKLTPYLPQIMADIAAGNYLAAMLLVFQALAGDSDTAGTASDHLSRSVHHART